MCLPHDGAFLLKGSHDARPESAVEQQRQYHCDALAREGCYPLVDYLLSSWGDRHLIARCSHYAFSGETVRSFLMRHIVGICGVAVPLLAAGQAPAVAYSITDSIKTGGHGDFYTLDEKTRRLYGTGRYIVDIDRKIVVDSLKDSAGGGFVIASELGRGFARSGLFFDLRSFRSLARIPYRGDASVYDPRTRRAFLLADTTTVIDMRRGSVTARIAIPGAGEFAVADRGGRLYLSMEGLNQIGVLDAQNFNILAHYSVSPGREPNGLAMDIPHRRLFSACDSLLVVLDANNGRVVATIPTDGHSEENAFDPGTQLVFMPSGHNGLTILHEDSPDKYTLVQKIVDPRVTTLRVIVDERTHRIFLPHTFEDKTFGYEIMSASKPTVSARVQ